MTQLAMLEVQGVDLTGVRKQVGERQNRFTVLNTNFNLADGGIASLALVNYDLTFNETFQTFMGSFAGKVYRIPAQGTVQNAAVAAGRPLRSEQYNSG